MYSSSARLYQSSLAISESTIQFWPHVLQILWHLDSFRRSFREIVEPHECLPYGCVFCVIKMAFAHFQDSSTETCLSSIKLYLQPMLNNVLNSSKNERPTDLLQLALQTLDSTLSALHIALAHTNTTRGGISCSAPSCLSHRQLRTHLQVARKYECRCGTPTQNSCYKDGVLESLSARDEVKSSYYQTAVSLSAKSLVSCSAQLRRRRGPDHVDRHAGHVIGRALKMNSNSCQNCGQSVSIAYELLNAPQVLMIALEWDSKIPGLNEIHDTIFSIGNNIKTHEIFDKCADPVVRRWNYALRGLVTITSGHFVTFFHHSSLNIWITFNDNDVREVGPEWRDVVQTCLDDNCQPLILIYAKVDNKFIKNPGKMSSVLGNVSILKERLAKSKFNFKSMQSLNGANLSNHVIEVRNNLAPKLDYHDYNHHYKSTLDFFESPESADKQVKRERGKWTEDNVSNLDRLKINESQGESAERDIKALSKSCCNLMSRPPDYHSNSQKSDNKNNILKGLKYKKSPISIASIQELCTPLVTKPAENRTTTISSSSSNVESFRKFLLANNREQRQQKQQQICNGIHRRDSGYLTNGDQTSTISNTSSGLTTNSIRPGGIGEAAPKTIMVESESVRSSLSSLEHGSSSEGGGTKENAKSRGSVDGDTTLIKCRSPICYKPQYPKIYDAPTQAGSNSFYKNSMIKAPSESLLLDTETKSDTFRCQALCSEAMSLMVQAEKCQRLEDYSGAICFSTNAASRARQAMDHHQADPESITQARVIYNKCVTMGRDYQAKLLSDRSSKHFPHRPNEMERGQKTCEIKENQGASLYGTLPRTSKLNKFKHNLIAKESSDNKQFNGDDKEVESKEIRRSEITLKFGRKETVPNTPPQPSNVASIQNYYKRRSEGIKEKPFVDNLGLQSRFISIQTNQESTKRESPDSTTGINMKSEKSHFRNLLSPKCPKSYHFLEELSRNLESEIDLMHQSLNQSTDSSNLSGGRISNSSNRLPKTSIPPPTAIDQNGRPYISYSPVPEKSSLENVQEIKTSENLASRKLKLLKHVNDSTTPASSYTPNPILKFRNGTAKSTEIWDKKQSSPKNEKENRILSKSIPYLAAFSPKEDTKIYDRPRGQTKIPTPPRNFIKNGDAHRRCQLCHKSQLIKPVGGNIYCEDCTFYMGKFRQK